MHPLSILLSIVRRLEKIYQLFETIPDEYTLQSCPDSGTRYVIFHGTKRAKGYLFCKTF